MGTVKTSRDNTPAMSEPTAPIGFTLAAALLHGTRVAAAGRSRLDLQRRAADRYLTHLKPAAVPFDSPSLSCPRVEAGRAEEEPPHRSWFRFRVGRGAGVSS